MTAGIVYRCYNAAGELLYVGNTLHSAHERMLDHRRLQVRFGIRPWVVDVVRVEEDKYPTWQEASAAEKALITALRPLHNKLHNPNWEHYREAVAS